MLTPLKTDGLLVLRGNKARDFLHGQSTVDLLQSESDTIAYGACCTPKGRAIITFMMFAGTLEDQAQALNTTEHQVYLRMPAETIPLAQKFLKPYAMLSRVTLEDGREQWAGFGLRGKSALAQASRLLGEIPQAMGDYCYRAPLFMVRRDEQRLECWCPCKHWDSTYGVLSKSIEPVDQMHWALDDIRSGMAEIYLATSEKFLPQMLNLEAWGGISYTKGCYTGQEVIARAHHLGKLKRVCIHAKGMGKAPIAGDGIYNASAQPCGEVIRVAMTGTKTGTKDASNYELLAVVRANSDDHDLYTNKDESPKPTLNKADALSVLKRFTLS